MNTPATTAYKPQLDALRAFAVSAVLIHHYVPTIKYVTTGDFLTIGLLAVRLFFVLSGYLITGILLRSRGTSFMPTLKKFYMRRTVRIFPIYYLSLIVLLIVGGEQIRKYWPWHFMFLTNYLVWSNPSSVMGSMGHFWTLSVEEQFYLLWPFAILFTPYKHLWKVIVSIVVLGICWKSFVAFMPATIGGQWPGAILTPACFDSLGIGGLLALVEHDNRLKQYRKQFLQIALSLGCAIVVLQTAAYFSNHLAIFRATAFLGVSLIFVWLVGTAAQGFSGPFGSLLSWSPLLYIGKISYGMYLYHNFMPDLVRFIGVKLGFMHLSNALLFCVSFFLTVAVASVSWYSIEKPFKRIFSTKNTLHHIREAA